MFTMRTAFRTLLVSIHVATVLAGPLLPRASEPDPSLAQSVTVGGRTFVNKGLVAFGLIPSNFRESTGDTMGGIGSAIAIQPGSFVAQPNGSYTGTLIVQPDRGFNVDGTVDYQGRHHQLDFVLNPHYDTSALEFTAAQQTLQLTYKVTTLYTERGGGTTTGLDATGVRDAQSGFPSDPLADPQMPIPKKEDNRLTLDLEGLVLNEDGTFWSSDEYGPYIYHFDASGALIQAIQPPDAIIPITDGDIDFESENDPDTGRAGNKGFEGLTIDKATSTLYAMLQTATIQDGGNKKSNSRYTRLLAYDVSSPTTVTPALKAEYIVPLPQDSDGKTLGSSEIAWVGGDIILALARDGSGHGDDNATSAYKGIDLVDFSSATNIAGSKFDSHKNAVAPKGKLDKSVTPATYTPFVSLIDTTNLARFGLHNGDPVDQTLIDAKWESIALVRVGDPSSPDDFFLFTASDNDFITTDGIMIGQPYNAGLDNDNQFLVWRVTLPGSTLP
ncbi:esterase-like activity of phytase-domain-containing protein [Irpex rosettiformis]|uniref:Esterase-like activity of phytase-domain-containing protein n=1 Tax=Irpex rosettiformis TaxID=378272 RepID=A0ACB8TSI1_9APHY|nr:esterase-like activity of phytase-domain-containing protein [Irpex rosettiformis]